MNGRYLAAAAACVALVATAYAWSFWHNLDRPISGDPTDWGIFGDYFGGLLNPALSFISILLIVKSLSLQREANIDFRQDLDASNIDALRRSFESKFFALIAAQSDQFKSFKLTVETVDGTKELSGANAVWELEELIDELRNKGAAMNIPMLLKHYDKDDQIYSCLRRFYVAVKLVMNDLSDDRGFTEEIRADYLESLINFTELSAIHMIHICMQYTDDYPSLYLKENAELLAKLASLGLDVRKV